MDHPPDLDVPPDLPPAYDDEADAPSPDKTTALPDSFYAANRFIYCSSAAADAPPTYELSHSLDSLNNSYLAVSFQRVIPKVKKGTDGTPEISTRRRALYDIKHSAPGTFPTVPFHAEPASRQAMCKLALESCRAKGHLFTRGFRICRATRRAKEADDDKYANSLGTRRDGRGVTNALSLGDDVFTVSPAKQKGIGMEWRDGDGQLVAVQENEQQLMKLNVIMEMTLMQRDALVASWIMIVWHAMAARHRLSIEEREYLHVLWRNVQSGAN